jgi:ABC-2 type transport system permease protein
MKTGLNNPVRRIIALLWKECLQIVRDPSSILIALVLPAVMMFLFGYGVSLDVSKNRVGVAVERVTPETTDFLQTLMGSKYFNITTANDFRALVPELIKGQIRGIVVLKNDFSRHLQGNNNPTSIQIITDGSEPNTATFIENYTKAAWTGWLTKRALSQSLPSTDRPVNVNARVWLNQEVESRYTLLPGAIPIVVTLVGTLLTTLVVAREWDRGTMEALIATPVTIPEILVSKFMPYFLLGLGTMTFCVLVAQYWFQVPFRGSYLALLMASSLYLFNALGLGLLISSATKNQFAASQAALFLAFLPAFLLSGHIFEISSMPFWVQQITKVFPARYFVTSLRTIFLAGDVWSVLWPCFNRMLLIASLLYLMIAMRTVKSME